MKDHLISFETAVLAKEKGFDVNTTIEVEDVFKYTLVYSTAKTWVEEKQEFINTPIYEHQFQHEEKYKLHKNEYHAPTQSLLQKWLREVHGIHIQPFYHPNTISTREIKPEVEIIRVFAKNGMTKSILPPSLRNKEFDTYEQAFEEGLLAALKLINLKP
jgi:hypothetical protein